MVSAPALELVDADAAEAELAVDFEPDAELAALETGAAAAAPLAAEEDEDEVEAFEATAATEVVELLVEFIVIVMAVEFVDEFVEPVPTARLPNRVGKRL